MPVKLPSWTVNKPPPFPTWLCGMRYQHQPRPPEYGTTGVPGERFEDNETVVAMSRSWLQACHVLSRDSVLVP